MKPTYYANKVDLTATGTEVILDLKLKAGGRPTEIARIILPHEVAAKLSLLLAPDPEPEPKGLSQKPWAVPKQNSSS